MLNIKSLLTNLLRSEPLLKTGTPAVMTRELKTSDGSVIIGSGEVVNSATKTSSSITIADILTQLRYSSGCMGSVYLSAAYTTGGVTIPVAWYNYLWIPHRTGGHNGTVIHGNDNCNYGTLLLANMTGTNQIFVIRTSNGSVANLYLLRTQTTRSSSTATVGTTTNYTVTNSTIKRSGRLVAATLTVTCNTPAQWPSTYAATGLPATQNGLEVYGCLLPTSSSENTSVAVAVQSNGSVKLSGGKAGQSYFGTVYYITTFSQ